MRFGVLGPLAVWDADGEPVAVPEAKVRALLADLLVSPGQVVSSDRLVEDLWGPEPPVHPLGALQTRVSRLRRVLDRAAGSGGEGEGASRGGGGREQLVHRPPGYVLRVADGAVDADRFEALTARARRADGPRERAALLTRALELWRGPAFADFADESFSRAAIAGLEEARLLAQEEQAEARLSLGEHGQLVGELAELTLRHPLRERLRAAHMRALYRAGRAGEALDAYQDLRRRLDEELGLAPGAELAALQREILRQDPALDGIRVPVPAPAPAPAPAPVPAAPGVLARRDARPRPRTNLPTPVTELIGRAEAVGQVRGLLGSGVGRMVTLTGPGGVGKTRLALETAAQLADDFADGVWLVELAAQQGPEATRAAATAAGPGPGPDSGSGSGPVEELAEAVAAALGIREDAGVGAAVLPPGGPRTSTERLTEALAGKRLLLVLDNCEHVVDQAAALAQALLRAAPGVRILATSQEPLDILGEQLWPVPPLDLPETAGAAGLRESSAAQLFVARAAAVSPGFALGDDNAAAVAAICRRLDGIPLALELAASRVRVLGAGELAERLDDRFRLLTGGHRGAPARQQTLRAVIDWSWELLTAAEQIVLRRLAVHSDGCTLDAAEAVCAGDGVKSAQVMDLVARLVDRSLVTVTHGSDGRDGSGPRYRLLESVAAYCLERLHAAEHQRVRRAHAAHYAALAERAEQQLRGGDQQRWLRRLDAEAANVRAALDWAVGDGDAQLARRLVRAMLWYWHLRGRLAEAKRSLSLALTLAPSPTVAAWLAATTMLSGDRSPTHGGGSSSPLRLYEAVGERHERARAGWLLAYAVSGFGDQATAEELTARVLADFRDLDDSWGVAAALATRGAQRFVRGDLVLARRDAEQSLALFRTAGDRWGQLYAMGVLGTLAEITGDYETAAGWHQDGLCIAEDLELWTAASTRSAELGRIALLTGDFARADDYHERALRLAVEQGDKPAEEFAEVGLALSARRQGKLDEAEAYLDNWIEFNRQFDAQHGMALLMAELGFIAELRGDADTALARHREGLAAARHTEDPRAIALAFEGLAGAHALAGRHERAARLLTAAADRRAAVGAPLPPAERADVDRVTAAVREALGGARGGTRGPGE